MPVQQVFVIILLCQGGDYESKRQTRYCFQEGCRWSWLVILLWVLIEMIIFTLTLNTRQLRKMFSLSYCHLQDWSTYYLFLFSDFIRPSRQIDIQSGLEFQYILRSRKHSCPCPICFTLGDMSLVTVTDWSLSGPGSRPHLYPASQHFVSFMIRTE